MEEERTTLDSTLHGFHSCGDDVIDLDEYRILVLRLLQW